MRAQYFTLVTAVAILTAGAASGKSYRAERYDVQLRLDQSGTLEVTETVRFRFSGEFRYVQRSLATTETDGITDVRAWMDGAPCGDASGPCQAETGGDSPVEVRWNFGPFSDQTHEFALQYRVAGVIRQEGGAQTLIWRALPARRSYRIDSSEIKLEYPAGARLRTAGLSGKRAGIFIGERSATAKMSNLNNEARVTLRAEFAPGSFPATTPRWQTRKQERTRELLAGLRTALLAGIPILAAVLLVLFRYRGSNPPVMAQPITTNPPEAIPPAMAAELAGSPHGAAGMLLDMARRGVFRIEELEKGRFGTKDFRVTYAGAATQLMPHEERLVAILFPHGETESAMSKIAPKVRAKWRRVRSALLEEMDRRGLLDDVKRRKRRALAVGGAIALVAGFAALGFAFASVDGENPYRAGLLFVVAGSMIVTAVMALIMGGTLAPWTAMGASAAAQWRKFRQYLKEVSRGRVAMPGPDALDRFLPYAAAFGLAQPLLKEQLKHGAMELPAWFGALRHGDGTEMAAFVAMMGAVSSTSAGAGAASGAGASGGGSSSAG